MQTQQGETSEVVTTGDFKESAFSIVMNEQTFRVLSSSLYSNKPLAIIRELACNALDAHVSAGTSDKPFVIGLPNLDMQQFSIRDFGTGLDDEGIRKVFCSYFNSSKTNDNNQIGGFGLGSKTPFSYTDMFSIISFFNGKKRTYVALLNEKGIPTVNEMAVEDTEEPNGLEISFPVKRNDFNMFYEAAKQALRPFKPGSFKIIGQNLTVSDWPKLLEGSNYFLSGNHLGIVIRMGNVDYPINQRDQLNDIAKNMKDWSKTNYNLGMNFLEKQGLRLMVPIGTVFPTPSRESIQIDKRSAVILAKLFDDVIHEYLETIKKELEQAKSIKEYRKQYTTLFLRGNSKYGWLKNQFIPTFDGEEVEMYFRTTNPIDKKYWITLITFDQYRNQRPYFNHDLQYLDIFLDDVEQYNIFVDDTTNDVWDTNVKKLEYYFRKKGQTNSCLYVSLYALTNHYKQSNCTVARPKPDEVIQFAADFFDRKKDDFILLSSMGIPKKPVQTHRDLTKYSHGVYLLTSHSVVQHTIDITKGGYYVPVDRESGYVLSDEISLCTPKTLYNAIYYCESNKFWVPVKHTDVICVSRTTEQKMHKEAPGKWKNIIDELRRLYINLLSDKECMEYDKYTHTTYNNALVSYEDDLFSDHNITGAIGELIKASQELTEARKAWKAWQKKYSDVLNNGKATAKISSRNHLETVFKTEMSRIPVKADSREPLIMQKYPLLLNCANMLHEQRVPKNTIIKHCLKYIESINKEEERTDNDSVYPA